MLIVALVEVNRADKPGDVPWGPCPNNILGLSWGLPSYATVYEVEHLGYPVIIPAFSLHSVQCVGMIRHATHFTSTEWNMDLQSRSDRKIVYGPAKRARFCLRADPV